MDKLLQEAEAATAAKTQPPTSPGATKTLTLASLRKLPRGPSDHPNRHHSAAAGYCGPWSTQFTAQQQWQQQQACGRLLAVLDKHGDDTSSARSDCSSSSAGDSAYCWMQVGSCTGKRHRRASSVPLTPPIAEADREGPDSTSFTFAAQQGSGTAPQHALLASEVEPTAHESLQQGSEEQQRDDIKQQQPAAARAGAWPFGLKPTGVTSAEDDDHLDADEADEDVAIWMDACSSSTALGPSAAAAGGSSKACSGPEGLRSLSGRMPTWLWPSSRLAVRDLTTDEIMQRISNSRDAAQLQHMARGLLCERNEWRFRATQVRQAG